MNYNFVIINLASFASYPVKMPNPPDLSRLFVAKVQFCLAYGTDPPRLFFVERWLNLERLTDLQVPQIKPPSRATIPSGSTRHTPP
jgi:hypothetical protein